MRAVQLSRFGGPEVLEVAEVADPVPGEGELLLEVSSAGVNYADTHQSRDDYLAPQRLPLVPGMEVVGRTPEGRRVVALVTGGYAELAVAAPGSTFTVPDGVADGQALALVLAGTTAWHLLRTSARLAEGETVVVHAAAGGVGSTAVQLARAWGAGRVVATASTPEKRDLAVSLGADVAVDGSPDGLRDRLREATDGRGADVVLEMVGGGVTDASLAALAPFGRLVVYGNASRTPPKPVHPGALMVGSKAVVGFWLTDVARVPGALSGAMSELLELVGDDRLRPLVHGTYPLSEARRAHEDLLARRTTGKLVLDPHA